MLIVYTCWLYNTCQLCIHINWVYIYKCLYMLIVHMLIIYMSIVLMLIAYMLIVVVGISICYVELFNIALSIFSHPFRRNGWLSIPLCVSLRLSFFLSLFVSFFLSTHFFSTLSKVSSIQLPQVTGARHSLLLFSSAGHPSKY